jgi:hypothetical protein
MTTFEIAKKIQRILITNAAETMTYECWNDEFATKNIRSIPGKVIETDWFLPINPNDFTSKEMDELGFGTWSKESGIRLIPLWMHPFLVDMFSCSSISETEPVVRARKDIDTDHRFGCLAYGVVKHE